MFDKIDSYISNNCSAKTLIVIVGMLARLKSLLETPSRWIAGINVIKYLKLKKEGHGSTIAGDTYIDKHPNVPKMFINFHHWSTIARIMYGVSPDSSVSGDYYIRLNNLRLIRDRLIIELDGPNMPSLLSSLALSGNKSVRKMFISNDISAKGWTASLPSLVDHRRPYVSTIKWLSLSGDITEKQYQLLFHRFKELDRNLPRYNRHESYSRKVVMLDELGRDYPTLDIVDVYEAKFGYRGMV